LVKEGFNLTHGLDVGAAAGERIQGELLVPPFDGEHLLRFWAEARVGTVTFRLSSPSGATVVAWSGRMGETTLRLSLPAGAYAWEVNGTKGGAAHALLGVRGPVIERCEADATLVREQPADPARGFSWPYLLYVPKAARARHLLVVPNNTGFASDDSELLRASASCELQRNVWLAEALGAPLLVPLFPRPSEGQGNLYLHALTRAALEAKAPAVARVDLQLGAMFDDARARLAVEEIAVSSRVLLFGFSASGSFVNRFAVLHPERVLAVAAGSPGGWPLAPVARLGDDTLSWPVGVADLQALTGHDVDATALKKVSWFFFMGEQDQNDSVPFRDSFSASDQALIFRRFGATPVSRWRFAERLYASQGLAARFKLYPGVAHDVTPSMQTDVERLFRGALERGE
jgi:pimeloyl-ACP methyl ester carboxylesterase